MDVDAITPAIVTQTLRAWQSGQGPPPDLLDLHLLADPTAVSPIERGLALQDHIMSLVSAELARQRSAAGLPPAHGCTRQELLDQLRRDVAAGSSDLTAWSALYHRYLAPVVLPPETLAAAIPVDPRSLRRHVNHGIVRLTDLLRRQEMAAHRQIRRRQRGRHLPPPDYSRLIGVDAQRFELAAELRRRGGPAVISIEGIGGIGKTALARIVAADLAADSDFEGIAWISARQSWLNESGQIESTADAATTLDDIATRLAAQLGLEQAAGLSSKQKLAQVREFVARAPQFIVIDNMESVSDVTAVLPALLPLAGPARLLITCRQDLSHYPRVQRFVVPPLGRADSQALLEAELARHARQTVLSPGDIDALYELLGGMPLALKLVAAQIGRLPLPRLLDGMRAAAGGPALGLYTYIYRQTWLALDDDARRLLLALLTINPDGETVDWLRLVSLLDEADFAPALQALLGYSLLETAGTAANPTYRLHRLTTTFLQTEILAHWDGEA